jgi:hypothetical protein
MLNNLYQRFTRMNAGQNPVNASDVSDDLMSTPSAAFRQAAGSGSLVSGTATIATGLNSVLSFNTILNGPTGFATGATEVSDIVVSSITTGSVVVKGTFNSFVTGAATISVSGTGGFFWQALGT